MVHTSKPFFTCSTTTTTTITYCISHPGKVEYHRLFRPRLVYVKVKIPDSVV